MSVTVSMPQLGETVTEGTILRWAKEIGDTVAEDEVLLEISTDKVDTEVPSPAAGTLLEILVPEGETVGVGTALAVIGEASEKPVPGEAEPVTDTLESAVGDVEAGVTDAADAAVDATESVFDAVTESTGEPEAAPAVEAPSIPDLAPDPFTATEPAAADAEPVVPDVGEVEAEAQSVPVVPADLGPLSPVVRKLAAESGIDLSLVEGTGRDGRITRRDVEAFIQAGAVPPLVEIATEIVPAEAEFEPEIAALQAPPEPEPVVAEFEPEPEPVVAEFEPEPEPVVAEFEPEPEPVVVEPEPVIAEIAPAAAASLQPPSEAPAAPAGIQLRPGDRVIDLDRIRTRIADNMVIAKRTAAHVWTSVEVDFEAVEKVRRRHKEAFKSREGFSLTYLPFIARAAMDALTAYPVVNSSFHQEEQQRVDYAGVHLGVAVDLNQGGLVVMTIPSADGMRMREIARRVRGIAEKARDGDIMPDDVVGSTFTITNPGPFGSFMSAPIINVPNVAILSTDTVTKRPVVVTDSAGNDAIGIRHVGYLGLTWDHRAFDGSTAVLFLRRIKEAIETWDWEHELG